MIAKRDVGSSACHSERATSMSDSVLGCFRVVQLGMNVTPATANVLYESREGVVCLSGLEHRARARFESKVGGGGHVVLEHADGEHFARVLVEPDGPLVNLMAAMLRAEFPDEDDVVQKTIRLWLAALHGIEDSHLLPSRAHGCATTAPLPHGGALA